MTFQPPPNQGNQPPQPGQPGQPQQPGQFGPPPGGGYPAGQPGGNKPAFDPKTVNPLDWGIIGAGVLAFLFSFISYYSGADITSGSRTETINGTASAWNDVIGGGFFNWFAMLFAIVGGATVAVALFAPHVKLPVPARLAGLGLFAAATLFIIIGIFVTPGDSSSFAGTTFDASLNHGFGFWVSLIVIIAGLVMSLMRFQQTGGQLPGGMGGKVPNIGGHGPQGGIHGGGQGNQGGPGYGQSNQPPPPPPGYGPPPQQ